MNVAVSKSLLDKQWTETVRSLSTRWMNALILEEGLREELEAGVPSNVHEAAVTLWEAASKAERASYVVLHNYIAKDRLL